VLAEALAVLDEDEQVNREASRRGADLVLQLCSRRSLRVLTPVQHRPARHRRVGCPAIWNDEGT
jgi:hypothetical protein